jgi:fructose-1,6-bisphosphatase/inositol monophosphatase family enzyme
MPAAYIVEVTGGIVSDADGGKLVYDHPCSVVARNNVVQLLS